MTFSVIEEKTKLDDDDLKHVIMKIIPSAAEWSASAGAFFLKRELMLSGVVHSQ